MNNDNAPEGLHEEGRELWDSVTEEFELGPHEHRMLLDACRTADAIGALEDAHRDLGYPATSIGSQRQEVIHPLIGEIRSQRAALRLMLVSLKLPAPEEEDQGAEVIGLSERKGPMSRSESGRIAAAARWANRG